MTLLHMNDQDQRTKFLKKFDIISLQPWRPIHEIGWELESCIVDDLLPGQHVLVRDPDRSEEAVGFIIAVLPMPLTPWLPEKHVQFLILIS